MQPTIDEAHDLASWPIDCPTDDEDDDVDADDADVTADVVTGVVSSVAAAVIIAAGAWFFRKMQISKKSNREREGAAHDAVS